jgi:GNAT superfamily N-acetyltransferase
MAEIERHASAAEIRRAIATDAPTLAQMRAQSSYERKGGDVRVRDAYARTCAEFFADELERPQSMLRTWVKTVAGTIVGGASLLIVPTMPRYGAAHARVRDGRVRDVYVVPAYRRRGIARALMLAVLAEAKAEHVDRLTLGASEMGAPLYLSIGFAYKRDETVYTGADPRSTR